MSDPWWAKFPALGTTVHVKPSGKRRGYYAEVVRYEKRGFTMKLPGMVVRTGDREVWVRLGETEPA